jgi:Zn-dependent metalloprotease
MTKANIWVSVVIGIGIYFQAAPAGEQTATSFPKHPRGLKLSIADSTHIAAEVEKIENSHLKNKDCHLRVKDDIRSDAFGTRRVKLQQYYKGVRVEGAELLRIVEKGDTLLDEGKGRTIENINIADVTPQITKEEAIQLCISHFQHSRLGAGALIRKDEPELTIFQNRLVYEVAMNETGAENNSWEFRLDAKSGEVLNAHKSYVYRLTPPSNSGANATVHGFRLTLEGGGDVSMTGWRDATAPQNYFLYFKGGPWGPWGVLNESTNNWVQQSTNDWLSTDPFSISAAKNTELTQKWLHDFLGYNSYDNKGTLAEVHTYDTDTKNGPRFQSGIVYLLDAYTDVFKVPYGQSGALDEVAHEWGHGVNASVNGPGTDRYYYYDGRSCYTSGESYDFYHTTELAQNESYSDIMGFAVEYASQPNNLSGSATSPGTADWLIGEDLVLPPYKAIRDFRYPQRANKAEISQPACTYYLGTNYLQSMPVNSTMCFFWFKIPEEEHILAEIQDFAFYLLAQGNDVQRDNDGHPYGVFAGVGVNVATTIALNALMNKRLNTWGTFQDARQAWYDAASDLISKGTAPANACDAVNAAWKAVGVEPELRISLLGIPCVQFGAKNGDFIVRQLCRPYETGTTFPQTGGPISFYDKTTSKGFYSSDLDGSFWSTGSFTENQTASLDNTDPNAFKGKLIVRAPNGKIQFAIDPTGGDMSLRKQGVQFGL